MKIKNICCIGAGYVGGPTMSVIALKCPDIKVTVVDVDHKKIDLWNDSNMKNLPVYEPGLSNIIKKVRGRNLIFSKDINNSIDQAEMIFMAVNTPTKTHGKGKGMAADLKYIEHCSKIIAKSSKTDKIIIEKSTLPVRTAEKVKEILNSNGKKGIHFEIISNPEFLAEGTAIQDLFKSDRVLIGGDQTPTGKKAIEALIKIYSNWIPRNKILTTNIWSSELSKLASNAMLAQRISSINSLSSICEKTDANIDELSKAIGMDHRIGPKFLKVSAGFGGSCFKKDILNLVYLCKYYGLNEVAEYWHQVVKINNYQKNRFAKKIIEEFSGSLKNKNIAILGWAFKAKTNDSRESASIHVSKKLIEAGAKLNIYDPMVSKERIYSDMDSVIKNKTEFYGIEYFDSLENSINNVDGIAFLTQWDEFINFNWKEFLKKSSLRVKIFDGRNFLQDHFKNYDQYFRL